MDDRDHRFEELCLRYWKKAVAYLRYNGRQPADAEDLAQIALLETWKHLDTIQPGAEWAYVRAAAHNRTINQVRDRARHPDVPIEAAGEPADLGLNAEEQLVLDSERQRFQRRFHLCVSQLPQETQLCIVLRRRGFSYQEVADRLGVAMTAVQSRLRRAHQHLRECLGDPPSGIDWLESAGDDDDHET